MSDIPSVGPAVDQSSGAEDLQVARAELSRNAARSKKQFADNSLNEARERLEEFTTLIQIEHPDIQALRKELRKATGFLLVLEEQKDAIDSLVDQVDRTFSKLQSVRGQGVEAVKVYADIIGDVKDEENDEDATGLILNIEDEETNFGETLEDFNLLVDEVVLELGDLEQEGSFLNTIKVVKEKTGVVDRTEGHLLAMKRALKSSKIWDLMDAGDPLKLAVNEIESCESIPKRNLKDEDGNRILRANERVAIALREGRWDKEEGESLNDKGEVVNSDGKVIDKYGVPLEDQVGGISVKPAIRRVQDAKVLVDGAEESATSALTYFNAETKDGVDELKSFLDYQWEEKVAFGLFKAGEDGKLLKIGEDYIIDVGEKHEDFISQGAYVELVNIVHSVEDVIQEESTLFTNEEREVFWGIKGEEAFTVVDKNGAEVVIKQTVKLDDASRAEARKENLTNWEDGTDVSVSLKDFKVAEETLDGMSDTEFVLFAGRIHRQMKALKSLAEEGGLSPGLMGQANWTADLSNLFAEAFEDLQHSERTGSNIIVEVPGGGQSEFTTAKMQACRDSFKTWQDVGGFNHLHHLKNALKQVTVAEPKHATIVTPSTTDLLFFEYATTGESSLNRQIGALGEAMEMLNDYLQYLNDIDALMSRTTLDVNHRGHLEDSSAYTDDDGDKLLTALRGLFEMYAVESDVYDSDGNRTNVGDVGQMNAGQRGEVGKILARAVRRLKDNIEPIDYDEGTAKDDSGIDSVLEDYGVLGTLNNTTINANFDPTEGFTDMDGMTGPTVKNRIHNLFNDEDFLAAVSNAITHGQGINDTNKQKLKKTMFIYEEFIKSAGTVMEKISEMIKGIAQRVGR